MPAEKLETLINILKDMQSVLLAYSGGVDSTFLLKAVKLSGIRALAVTACSETFPEHDLMDAELFSGEIGIEHMLIRTNELENEDFAKNPPKRCFYCKDALFGKLKTLASEHGFRFVIDGSNLDDTRDYRPGMEAAKKHEIRSPLIEAGFTKEDIRGESKMLGLPSWCKPSSPCLSSRFPYGMKITREALKRVSEAEDILRSMGFSDFRIRDHGDIARVEVSEVFFSKIMEPETRKTLVEKLRGLGYKFISLDLEGFRSGSMNRLL